MVVRLAGWLGPPAAEAVGACRVERLGRHRRLGLLVRARRCRAVVSGREAAPPGETDPDVVAASKVVASFF